jgi:type I restriction enzyme R subunit
VDCVGVCESELSDSRPLDRQKGTPFKKLLDHVAAGGIDEAFLSSLASRLARLEQQCDPEQHEQIERVSGGIGLGDLTKGIFKALAPERQEEVARAEFSVPEDKDPTPEQLTGVVERLCREAVAPLATKPQLREALREIKRQTEQIIDDISTDEVLLAGASDQAKEKAKALVGSFEQFIQDHRDEIDALQFLYSHPVGQRLRYKDVKDLVAAIKAPPRSWTPERLWRAYEVVAADKVKGTPGERLLTDVVSLVRFAIHQDDELVPFREQVMERFAQWIGQQENSGRQFTPEQRRWLEMMRDHVATSLEIGLDDLDYVPFRQEGGLGKAQQVFEGQLDVVLRELNEVLAA